MVIVGYGRFANYRIQEVPESFLKELGETYKLSYEVASKAKHSELQLTVAIHEEIQRTASGGAAVPRRPTAKELARKLVAKGYQSLSKDHHPDRGGACEQIRDLDTAGAEVGPITDEDIPF